ncbi:MAG: hypothetical protein QXP42_03685 [Candidatus Micrarchaeia archaeon]
MPAKKKKPRIIPLSKIRIKRIIKKTTKKVEKPEDPIRNKFTVSN